MTQGFFSVRKYDSRTGFWIAFGLMAAVGVGLAVFFRRKRYLGTSVR